MIVYGASGHGKVVIEILEQNGHADIELWDDAIKPDIWQYPVVRPDTGKLNGLHHMVIAIGNNKIRKMIAGRYAKSVQYMAAIHPATNISGRSMIAGGTVVMAGVTINADTTVGEHCIINTNASVDHDCRIDDFVHVSPNASLCGNISVGEGTHIGAGATVIPNLNIGKWCTIGAGAMIIKDIPDYAVVVGNPGRIIKYNVTTDS